jgi:hypothetical protein
MEIMEIENRDDKGRFIGGHKGFKPKGATNISTREVKERFQQLLDSYPLEQMMEDLQNLKPRERLNVVAGLLEYFMPKLNKTDWGISNNKEKIIIELPENNEDRFNDSRAV